MPEEALLPDTACLIGLSSVGLLGLLEQCYRSVTIAKAVSREFGAELPSWVETASPGSAALVKLLRATLGPGEAETIALATERPESVAILDDRRARETARELGLTFTGTVGVILRGKREGHVDQIGDIVDSLAGSGFRLSKELRKKALQLAGEDPSTSHE